jgi:hypothetical protein
VHILINPFKKLYYIIFIHKEYLFNNMTTLQEIIQFINEIDISYETDFTTID